MSDKEKESVKESARVVIGLLLLVSAALIETM